LCKIICMKTKKPHGRPRKFETPKQLQGLIDDYFDKCDNNTIQIVNKDGEIVDLKKPIPYTVEGLAVALNTNRETLLAYQTEYEESFSDIIKNAKAKIALKLTEKALMGEVDKTVYIFLMKANMRYKEAEEDKKQDVTINIVNRADD
jgi:hypothetical protein